MNEIIKHEDLSMMPITKAQNWYNEFVEFSKSIMKSDLDYGIIPGTQKPSLYKAGAEKLRVVYGLGTEIECINSTVDLDRPFINYTYRCTVSSKQGQILSQCEGSCNSMEPKFGYLWKTAKEIPSDIDLSTLVQKTVGKDLFEFDFAIQGRKTDGKYGKPKEYWDQWDRDIKSGTAKPEYKQTKNGQMKGYIVKDSQVLYRLPNPDVVGLQNTIMKMAQKRAFVGAILLATGASEFYTQDIEDMEINGAVFSNEKPEKKVEEVIAEEIKETIPGHWYAKLEKCKTPTDVDELGKKNADTINANPELRKLFAKRKSDLKKETDLPF